MDKVGLKVIVILGCVFYVLLLWMCVNQMLQSSRLVTRTLEENPIPPKLNITLQVTDSIVNSDGMAELDSAIKVMREWNDYCDENLIHGLDDLRQETNNVIEKQNGWFSFWLGILALVGALLPFTVQLKIQQDQKQRIDAELDKLEKLDEERKKSKLYADITKLSFALLSCQTNRWAINNYSRNHFWNGILDILCKKTDNFIDSITDRDGLHDDNLFNLKMILLQLHSVYSMYLPMFTRAHKSRQLQNLISEIGSILDNLSNNRYTSTKDLRGELELMSMHMDEFQL